MKEEFLKVYEQYKNDIFRLCLSYTKNVFDAEDIVQNVFLKYYKNKDKVTKENIKNWLIKVAINESKTLFSSSWLKKVRLFKESDERTLIVQDKDNNLLESVFKLPKKERLIIHLYYYENYKIKEIANILKISEANVKVKLHRSRKKLKDLLEED